MKYLYDMRDEADEITLERISEVDDGAVVVVTPTQFTYLEQALMPILRSIGPLRGLMVGARECIPVRKDDK